MGEQSTINLLSNINNSLNKIVQIMLPQNRDKTKENINQVKNLSQGGLSSNTAAAASKTADTTDLNINIAQVVSALDGLPEQVLLIAKLSGSTIKNFKMVMTDIISVFTNEYFSKLDNDSAKSSTALISALGNLKDLPEMLKAASNVKEKDVKTFTSTVDKIMEMLSNTFRKTKVSKDDIELAKNTAQIITALSSAVKKLAAMSILAPAALVGITLMIPVWMAFATVAMLIGKIAVPVVKGLRTLNQVDKFLNRMLKTALLGLAVAGGVLLLGMMVKQNLSTMLFGLAGLMLTFVAIGTIAILGGLIGMVVKVSNIFTKDIILFTLGLIAIASLTILLGMLLKETWKEALIGLAGMTVMLGYTLLLGIAANFIGIIGLDMARTKTMAGLVFITLGLITITALTVRLGKYVEENIGSTLVGLTATLTILGEVTAVSYAARFAGTQAKSAVLNLLICEGVILGALGIVYASVKAGEFLWNYIHDEKDIPAKFGLLFAAVTAIIMGAYGVSVLAERVNKKIEKGAIALLLAEGVIVTSGIVLLAMIGLSKVMESSGITGEQIFLIMGIMGSIVAGAGALAFTASKMKEDIMKGALALAAIELLLLGMTGIIYAVIKTSQEANKLNNGWLDVLTCVGFMGGLVAAFTALTTGIGLLAVNPVVAIALGAGVLVLLGISGLIYTILNVTKLAIQTQQDIQQSGVSIDELGKFLKDINTKLFTYDTFNPDISILEAAKLRTKYELLKPALQGITSIITIISEMAKQFGGLSEVKNDEYYVSPYYGMNGNEPVFGKPVNIPKIANNIVIAITDFSDILYKGFKGINLNRLEDIGLTMGYLVEPVSKFAQMLTAFKESDGTTLKPVFISSDGKVTHGDPVDVIAVANTIANSITIFTTELYGSGDEAPKWIKLGKGKHGRRLEHAMSTLSVIIDPIDQFINLLLGYQSAGPGMLKKSSFDTNGNYIENGAPAVNVAEISGSIASSIKIFAETLFGDDAQWMSVFKKSRKSEQVNRVMSTLSSIISPIQSFIDAITSMEPSGGELYYVWVDNNGNIKRKKIDLQASAMAIAGAVSIFVEKLFGPETTNAWKNMMLTSSLKNENGFSSLSVFGEIIDPISNFVRVLSDIGGESDGNNLILPIYDKDGKQIGKRSVDLLNTATVIANAVTTFVETLFGEENKNLWISLVKTSGNTDDGIEKGISVFAAVIDPVIKFTEVVSKFGGTPENFRIYNGKESRTINLIKIAESIAGAITAFMSALKPAFGEMQITSEERQRVMEFAEVTGSILESFTKIGDTKKEQINVAQTVITAFFKNFDTIKVGLQNMPKKEDVSLLKEVTTDITGLFTSFADINVKDNPFKEVSKTIDNVTSSVTNFDNRLIKNADDRRKKIEELTKEVGKLNEKLDETSKNLEKISDTIENVNIGKINELSVSDNLSNIGIKPNNTTVKPQEALQEVSVNPETIAAGIKLALTHMSLDNDAMVGGYTAGDFGGNTDSTTIAFMNAFMNMFADMNFTFKEK